MSAQSSLVEVVTDGAVDGSLVDFMMDRFRSVGLYPLSISSKTLGSVIERIEAATTREALKVLSEGLTNAMDLDTAFRMLHQSTRGPCQVMDRLGLDSIARKEQLYDREQGLSSPHVQWLVENYVARGRLGYNSGLGGLYGPRAPGSRTEIFFLNVNQNNLSPDGPSTRHSQAHGQVLSIDAAQGGLATQIVGHIRNPDGM